MEHRFLGASGFQVSALGFGTGTFGGSGPLFGAWGNTDVTEARRLVDLCLDHGVTLFDSADVYSDGASESILGAAIRGRRQRVILSTKLTLRAGDGPNDVGASRHHLIAATDRALARLGVETIDVLQLHHFDAMTPLDSVMATLDDLVRGGKVVVDALDAIAAETGKSIPQIAINWLLQRPTVASVLIGARTAAQLEDNLGAIGWQLTAAQMAALDAASAVTPPYPYYPYWNGMFTERNPPPVPVPVPSDVR